jgi:hypothetical protein
MGSGTYQRCVFKRVDEYSDTLLWFVNASNGETEETCEPVTLAVAKKIRKGDFEEGDLVDLEISFDSYRITDISHSDMNLRALLGRVEALEKTLAALIEPDRLHAQRVLPADVRVGNTVYGADEEWWRVAKIEPEVARGMVLSYLVTLVGSEGVIRKVKWDRHQTIYLKGD